MNSLDKMNEKFSIKKRLKSFVFAWAGILVLLKEEHNARIHLAATIIVIFLGVWLNISKNEWGLIVLSLGGVWGMESINSAIENLADFISPEKHDKIKKIKDLSAAAVLFCAIAAATVGVIVFLPKLLMKMN